MDFPCPDYLLDRSNAPDKMMVWAGLMRMKKWLVILISVLLMVIGYRLLVAINNSALSVALVHDVSDYVSLHEGDFPNNWEEFCHWRNSKYEGNRWNAEELNAFYALPWGRNISSFGENENFIATLKPSIMSNDDDLNDIFDRSLIGYRLDHPE